MKTPITLGLMVLLAACGGSGSQTVVDKSDAEMAGTPDPLVADDKPLVVEVPKPVVSPDVLYEPELGGLIEFDVAAGRLVVAGVEVDLATADSLRSDETRTVTSYNNNVITFAQVVDGDAFAVSAIHSPGLSSIMGDFNAEGRLFSVADINSAPSGRAEFSGVYAGVLVSTGVLTSFRDRKDYNVIGDAKLSVVFEDTLSDSTLTGGITNRATTSRSDGYRLSDTYVLNDIVFEDVTIGDDGVFVGTFSGGALGNGPRNTNGFDYAIENPTIAGQIGGGNGETVVGVLKAEQYIFDTLDVVVADRFELYESGAFLVTSD